MIKRILLHMLLWLALPAMALASGTVSHIEFKGLYRVTRAQLSGYNLARVGMQTTPDATNHLIQGLYDSGYFSDIQLYQKGGDLTIQVKERPVIGTLVLKGNEAIKTKDLKKVLAQVGLQQGNVFDPMILSRIKQSLEQQYYMLGKYSVQVKTTIAPLPRNRIKLEIHIKEGVTAKIVRIGIFGNHAFSKAILINHLPISRPGFLAFFSDSDQYSPQKLSQSIEALNNYYQNHGYIDFQVTSHQVSIDPTYRYFFINFNLAEGAKYTFSKVKVVGIEHLPKALVWKQVQVKPGQVYSRAQVVATVHQISDLYANHGYAFANVNPVIDRNPTNHQVSVVFYVNPNRKVYIKQINFFGNNVTDESVFRQRMLITEQALYNKYSVDQSTLRMQRLPYVGSIDEKTVPVPNSVDQANVNYTLKERSANQLRANIGYSELDKFILGFGISMPNMAGTGNLFSIDTQLSRPVKTLNFTYSEPYFTLSGISQTISVYLQNVNNAYRDLANYSTDSYGANLTYGIPVSAVDNINIGGGVDHTSLEQPANGTSTTVSKFILDHRNNFNTLSLTLGWSRLTTNDAYFPTAGINAKLSGTIATPLSTMTWYKTHLSSTWYFPSLFKRSSISIGGQIQYGGGYGKDDALPFFNDFYAGGWGSVRGFASGSLGPRDRLYDPTATPKNSEGNALGGNYELNANINSYWPMPFSDSHTVRLLAFADMGNVYSTHQLSTYDKPTPTHPSLSNLRYSVGVGLVWISPIGPLGFSFAKPFNVKDGDSTQFFQFTLGYFNF